MNLPKFLLYGENNPNIDAEIQPVLALRKWSELTDAEKQIAFHEFENNGWFESYSPAVFEAIEYLNHIYLRLCPGKHLHAIKPDRSDYRFGITNESERMQAARMDFEHIFLHEKNETLVFRMLSKFADHYIDRYAYGRITEAKDEQERERLTHDAFGQFDNLSSCLNHIFEQFAVNQLVTRNGFVPRQDQKITDEIYTPTLLVLSGPKWRTVSSDLSEMFEDYRNEDFPEVITKAHRSVQRFLQILVGEEGKNGIGEMGKLFKQAKDQGIIPTDRFTEPILNVIQAYLPSERATNSTAKPALKEATASDAMLMMNVIMILMQHILQKQG